MQSLEERFFNKVNKTEDCWLWAGRKNAQGYGRFDVGDGAVFSHRLVLHFEGLDVPSGMDVLHRCDTPACVNPEHLWLGTHVDNMQDMLHKGRHITFRGSAHKRALLTEQKVLEIRADKRNNAPVAKEYGVSASLVGNIRARRCWKHV
jgi:hypothetical protein